MSMLQFICGSGSNKLALVWRSAIGRVEADRDKFRAALQHVMGREGEGPSEEDKLKEQVEVLEARVKELEEALEEEDGVQDVEEEDAMDADWDVDEGVRQSGSQAALPRTKHIRNGPRLFTVEALELMRRTALEGHLHNKRLMVVAALQHTMFTGVVPEEAQMVSEAAAKRAYTVLGAYDDWLDGKRNAADEYSWSLASVGASKKRPHGLKHMRIAAMSRWCPLRGTPMAYPLTCREIPYEDAQTSAEHDIAAGDGALVNWSRLSCISGDHTAHAVDERCRVVEMCESRGVSMVAQIEGCHRHGVQLEETNGFNLACPGGHAMDLVRLIWETLAHKPGFYKEAWEQWGAESELKICSEPTDSKWEVVEETFDWVIRMLGCGLRKFGDHMRHIMRGSTTGNWDKAARDSHIDNWDRICGCLADPKLVAQVRLRWEFSNRYVNKVHMWCKTR
jgi:hypothetical protein